MTLATIARGDASRIAERRRSIVRSPEEWVALWAAHAGPESDPPVVDFASTLVAGAFAGERPSAGYAIEIVGAIEEEGGTRLVVEERSPAAGMANAQVMTSPFHLVTLPRQSGEMRWTEGSARPGGHAARPAPATGSRRAPTASGLKPTTAAALAYVAGPISGAIVLFAEPAHRLVRFHAWQSMLALGGLGLAMIACYGMAVVALFYSANAVAFFIRAATGVWVLTVLVSLGCMWRVLAGATLRLPLVARAADRLATSPRGNAAP